jgi:uncharacterized protein (TIGR00730 family)
MRSVCVYCGSSPGLRPEYAAAARELGTLIGQRGIRLIYGGGRVGLMGIAAQTTLAAGGSVTGVIPEALYRTEVAFIELTDLRVVTSMHERKAMMTELSDAFIALPGGFGTLDELFEALSWAQLRIHRHPVGLLNVAGFYDPLLAMLDTAAHEGFLRPAHRALLHAESDPARLLDRLDTAFEQPAPVDEKLPPKP